jgi:TRAP-type C4-dicarboxylate transport system substrate-binding protein
MGTLVYTIAMNLDKFNALSKEDQELLLKAGRDSETGAALAVAAAGAESIAALKAAGMQETVLDPAVFEKLNAGMKAAIWKDSIAGNQQTAARVEELYEMAKKNGDAE